MENFFHTLQTEFVYDCRYENRAAAPRDTLAFNECFTIERGSLPRSYILAVQLELDGENSCKARPDRTSGRIRRSPDAKSAVVR